MMEHDHVGIYHCSKRVGVQITRRVGGALSDMESRRLVAPQLSLERMPSFTESENSIFSNVTEAESEMTEGGEEEGAITPRQTYFMCYATDLLGAYEQIKKRGLSGAKAMDDLCVMIKARIAVEETYAKGLEKVANQAFKDDLEPGTFREALEGLRADLLNKAVQHRQLANNLSSDILEPLSDLKSQLGSKIKALVTRAGKLQRDTRHLDEKYRRSHVKYTRCHKEAALCLTAAVEGGAVPSFEPRGRQRQIITRSSTLGSDSGKSTKAAGGNSFSTPSKTSSQQGSGTGDAGTGTPAGPSPASTPRVEAIPSAPLLLSSRRRAMSATLDKVREAMPSSNHNKKDLVQWFLPSDKHRKEGLIEAAHVAAEAAEETRKACRINWDALRKAIHGAVQEFQQVVTDFQGCEEKLVSQAQDGMRKHVVFESSTLANQQYDIQMLFKLMETVNVEMDLRNFIRAARREVSNDAAVAAQAAEVAEAEAEAEAAGGVSVFATGSGLSVGGKGYMGSSGGAGVLSKRADSRAAAMAFHNLFGVGPDLPAPPPQEPWSPPETAGDMPSASHQALVELFEVPLMTKKDISKYLDATDPVAGAAASEAAAAAIKALGATALDDGKKPSADAQADAALAKLPSHYPMVTPAASVFEILSFAAQMEQARSHTGSGAANAELEFAGGPAPTEETGPAEATLKAVSKNVSAVTGTGTTSTGSTGTSDASFSEAGTSGPTRSQGASGAASSGIALAPALKPDEAPSSTMGASSSDVASRRRAVEVSTGSGGENSANPAKGENGALTIGRSGSGGGGGGGNSREGGSKKANTSNSNGSPSGKGHSGTGSGGGMAAVFAAAAAAFGAADSALRQKSEHNFTVLRSKSAEIPATSYSKVGSTETNFEPSVTAQKYSNAYVMPSTSSNGEKASVPAPEAEKTATQHGETSKIDSAAKEFSSALSTAAAMITETVARAASAGEMTSGPGEMLASTTQPKSEPKSESPEESSPCLTLAVEQPYVFAATLADDVLESLLAEGAAAPTDEANNADEGRECSEGDGEAGRGRGDPAAVVAKAVEALLRDSGVEGGDLEAMEVDAAEKACADSPFSSQRLLLALCTRACRTAATVDPRTSVGDATSVMTSYVTGNRTNLHSSLAREGARGGGRAGFAPMVLSPRSFRALARLLRASLDQAAADKEFLQARNCLVASGLFAVHSYEYVSWLRKASVSQNSFEGGQDFLTTIDAELIDTARVSSTQLAREDELVELGKDCTTEKPGTHAVGLKRGSSVESARGSGYLTAAYFLQRELSKHPVWAIIELWEVALSDSVVMAVDGGGVRAERWLPAWTLSALQKRFGEDASGRQLDVKLGQLAFLGHSMLVCGLPPSEIRSILRKCSSLAMEIPPSDLDALMAVLECYIQPSSVNHPGTNQGRLSSIGHGCGRAVLEDEEQKGRMSVGSQGWASAERGGFVDDDDMHGLSGGDDSSSDSSASTSSSTECYFSGSSSQSDQEDDRGHDRDQRDSER